MSWLTPDNTRGTGAPTDLSITTDPLLANRYNYVNGDPINYTDPTGHCRGTTCNAEDNRALGRAKRATAQRINQINEPAMLREGHQRRAALAALDGDRGGGSGGGFIPGATPGEIAQVSDFCAAHPSMNPALCPGGTPPNDPGAPYILIPSALLSSNPLELVPGLGDGIDGYNCTVGNDAPSCVAMIIPFVGGSALRAGDELADASRAAHLADELLDLPTSQSWGRLDTLDDHFLRHGADFGATSADDYARQASEFFQRAQQGSLPTRIDSNGVIRVYDPSTNAFGAFNPDGTTRTFFTPGRGADYWADQPGSDPWTG